VQHEGMSGSLVRDSHRRVINEVTTHEEDAMRVTLEQVETAMNHLNTNVFDGPEYISTA
jgi:hypothetical protein